MNTTEWASVGVRASGRTAPYRIRWSLVLGTFDLLMIAAAVVTVPDVAVVVRAVFASALFLAFLLGGMYTTRLHLEALGRAPRTVGIVTVVTMALVTTDLFLPSIALSADQVFRLWWHTVALLLLGRLVASPARQALFSRAERLKTVIIGSGLASVLVAEKIDSHPELGLTCVGFVDDGPRRSVRGRDEPLLGGLGDIVRVVEETGAQVVIFGYTHNATEEMLVALYQVEPCVEVLMMPRFFQFVSAGMRVDDLAGLPLLHVNRAGLTRAESVLKRAEDVVLGGLICLLLLPLLPIVALAIKLDSPGPVFFRHARVGKNGKPFLMYKLRSMRDGSETEADALARLAEEDARGLKAKDDDRITKLGAFLRKYSIDEMPQFINVLRGEMSLVGPRPAVAAEVAAYDEWQKKRLLVAPGVTGMWQVNGRSDVPFDERIWLDFMYIDSWSLWLDLSIILQTVPAVLSARGAY